MILIVLVLTAKDQIEKKRIQRAVAQAKALCQGIRPGTGRATVESFLQRKGIEHSFVRDTQNRPEYGGTEYAIIRNLCGRRFVRCDVTFTFRFDDRDLLKDCSAKDVYTGS